MTRAILYVRVSTDRQDSAVQLPELEALAAARGWRAEVRAEVESGAKRRPVLEGAIRELRAGDVLAVWALDRLGRSMVEIFTMAHQLEARGVSLVSVRESWLDTTGPLRGVLVALFAWVAEQERARLIERTRAGLERTRAKGTRLGRPSAASRTPIPFTAAAEAVSQGRASIRAAAREWRISESTLRRFMAERAGRCAKNGTADPASQAPDRR